MYFCSSKNSRANKKVCVYMYLSNKLRTMYANK